MEYPPPASVLFSTTQTLCKKCEIYYEREHAHFPNIPVGLRKRGNDDLENASLYTHTALHRSPGPVPRPQPAPSSWALTAGGTSAESQPCRLKSPSGSPAPSTRLIQTPALSVVHPPRLFPAEAEVTQVRCVPSRTSTANRPSHHLEFFPLLLNLIFPFLLFPLSCSCRIPLDHPLCLPFQRVEWNFPTWFGL